MSAEALASVAPAGELAILQRVQQLQTLIEQARQVSASGVSTAATATAPASYPAPGSAGDFASALQAATAADAGAGVGTVEDPTQLTSAVPTGESSSAYDPLIEAAAQRYGVDPAILHGLIEQESGFDPTAQSSAGASGLTQLMPGTATSLGVANPLDPAESIEGGARYLAQLTSRFGGNTTDALAAYNAGPGAVQQYGGVPPYTETQNYVSKVLGYAEAYRQTHPASSVTGGLA